MQIPSVSVEALLNTMRDQISRQSGSPQQVQQIVAQTVRKLDTLESAGGNGKGAHVDVKA